MTSSPRKRRVSGSVPQRASFPAPIKDFSPASKSATTTNPMPPISANNPAKVEVLTPKRNQNQIADEKEKVLAQLLQGILDEMPEPASLYRVRKPVGSGTFSTVFHAEWKNSSISNSSSNLEVQKKCDYPKDVAIKHIVPTSSPDRVYVEVECLRMADGRHNVIPLHFCFRLKGEIILAMPIIRQGRFSDTLKTLTYHQMVLYMKNLLEALAHIHSLGIIHRDIKPANFLFNFKENKFGLTDFGLAQLTGQMKEKPAPDPTCKRKLSHKDFNSSSSNENSGSPKRKKMKLQQQQEKKVRPLGKGPRTPSKWETSNPSWQYYDTKGNLVKQEPPKSRLQRQLEEEDAQDAQEVWEEKKAMASSAILPPHRDDLKLQSQVRRSPRKHQPVSRRSTGFSKIMISRSTIVGTPTPASIKRTPSFTMLDPNSGIPSNPTAGLQASLTSRSNYHATASNPPPVSRYNTPSLIDIARCPCFGLPKTCPKCTGRRSQKVARAGTAGFRPPEVLLKSEKQTFAVDVWAAGVILLSMMSRTYPFFRAQDDIHALGELICIFGTDAIRQLACQLGKRLVTSQKMQACDLGVFSTTLAKRGQNSSSQIVESLVTSNSLDLLQKLLCLSPNERITAEEALEHPMFADLLQNQ